MCKKFAADIAGSDLLSNLEDLLAVKCDEADPDKAAVAQMQEGLQMTHTVLLSILKTHTGAAAASAK